MYVDYIQVIIKRTINSPNSNSKLIECISDIMNWFRNDLLVKTSKNELGERISHTHNCATCDY